MTTEKKDVPNVIMLPPILIFFHVIAGIVLDFLYPINLGHAWGWLGLILLLTCFGIIAWCKKLFDVAGTPVPPNQPATAIVTTGAYAYSRNPMYLSFMIGYVGLSLLADAPAMLLLGFVLFYFLDQRVIAPEEKYLSEKFGTVYTDYKDEVRRWI